MGLSPISMKNIPFSLIEYIKGITDDLVTKAEYEPVKAIVFGMAGIILVSALYAILKGIFCISKCF
jgi:hypothetical protein